MVAMSTMLYPAGLRAALGGGVTGGRDWDSDTFVITCHTSSYTPSITHVFQSDLTNELGTGNGYTAGGLTIASPVLTSTAADSWSLAAATSTAYAVGQIVRPATPNGYLYRCVVAGTSGGSVPTWGTTFGRETVDGTVVWLNIGKAGVTFKFTDPSFPSFSAGPFRHVVLTNRTPGTAATNPLIAAMSFPSDQTGLGGPFVINLDAVSGLITFGQS